MELRHMRYFVAVAEELNFTRAAQRLGIGQPPLSKQIRDLEAEIGEALFYRMARGAELTEAGRVFLSESREILMRADRATLAAQRAARGDTGCLRLGFTTSSMFNPISPMVIRRMRRRFPNLLLQISEGDSLSLANQLLNNDIDAAFVRSTSINVKGVDLKSLGNKKLVLALPSGHPLAKESTVSLPTLAHEPFILSGRSSGVSFHETILSACRAGGFVPIVSQEIKQITSIINLVAAEAGVALVPESIAQISVRGVVYREIRRPSPTISLSLATRRSDRSIFVRAYISIALAACRDVSGSRK